MWRSFALKVALTGGVWPRPSTARCLVVDKGGVRLIHLIFTNFNISSVFGINDTLLSYNPSALHSKTPRPGDVEGLGLAHSLLRGQGSRVEKWTVQQR